MREIKITEEQYRAFKLLGIPFEEVGGTVRNQNPMRCKYLAPKMNSVGYPSKYKFNGRPVGADELWFAWHPVSVGALGTGSIVWLKYVLRIKIPSGTIYQKLDF